MIENTSNDHVRKGPCPHCGRDVTIRERTNTGAPTEVVFHASVHHEGIIGADCAKLMTALREELKGLLALRVKQAHDHMQNMLREPLPEMPEWAERIIGKIPDGPAPGATPNPYTYPDWTI